MPKQEDTFHGKRSLLERFFPEDNDEILASSYHTVPSLVHAISEEISRLLKERAGFSKCAERSFASPYDYGLGDLAFLQAREGEFFGSFFSTYLQEIIAHYEPRLRDVEVRIEEANASKDRLFVKISGFLSLQKALHPIMFPVTFNL